MLGKDRESSLDLSVAFHVCNITAASRCPRVAQLFVVCAYCVSLIFGSSRVSTRGLRRNALLLWPRLPRCPPLTSAHGGAAMIPLSWIWKRLTASLRRRKNSEEVSSSTRATLGGPRRRVALDSGRGGETGTPLTSESAANVPWMGLFPISLSACGASRGKPFGGGSGTRRCRKSLRRFTTSDTTSLIGGVASGSGERCTTHYACAMVRLQLEATRLVQFYVWIERLTATVLIMFIARRCMQVEYDTRLAADLREREAPAADGRGNRDDSGVRIKASQPAADSRDGPPLPEGGGEERRATRG